MAARLLPLQSILHLFQPAAAAQRPLFSSPLIQRVLLRSSIPLAAFAGAADILREIWDGLLRAVPKKKTSHMKKRHRQMAGKGLKDVTHLTKCSACGKLKRAHVLCPYCVQAVRTFVKQHVIGKGEFQQQQPRPKTTYNAAETAPGAWEALKKKWKQRAKAAREEKEDDKTKW